MLLVWTHGGMADADRLRRSISNGVGVRVPLGLLIKFCFYWNKVYTFQIFFSEIESCCRFSSCESFGAQISSYFYPYKLEFENDSLDKLLLDSRFCYNY